MNKSLKQFTLVSLLCSLPFSLLAACSPGETKKEGSATNAAAGSKPFAGKTLTVYLANLPWAEAIKPHFPEFEEKTGMKLDVQSFYEDQLTQKLSVQLVSGSESPDVFINRLSVSGKQFHKNGWVEPLDTYVKSASADYDINDFTESSISVGTFDGKLTAIPVTSEQEVLYYRKDLLEKANIQVPKTVDELYKAAVKLHDPANGKYGFMTMTSQGSIVTQASSFVFSEGGDFIRDGKATLNSPETVKGLSSFINLLKDAGPPEKLNVAWPQALDMFAQGNVAFFMHANSIHDGATNPQKSKVVDQLDFAPVPAGAKGSVPYNITPWALSINANSKQKDAAWTFIEWATNKENVLRTQKKGTPGSRKSVWENPEGTSGFPKNLAAIFKSEASRGVDHNGPNNINVVEARSIVGDVIVKAILGGDLQQLAEKGNNDLQALLDKEQKQFK